MVLKAKRISITAIVVVLIAILFKNKKYSTPTPVSSLNNLIHNFTLLGTNDLHSSIDGIGLKSYQKHVKGGYDRLIKLIDGIRSEKVTRGELVLTFDAGDWFIGSLYDILAVDIKTSTIPQLQFFHDAKYDVIIFGNHEFDRLESDLYIMLDKASNLSLDLNFLISNLNPLPETSLFNQFFDPESSVKFSPYLIKETAHTKIGVLGYMTPDALFVSNDNRKELQFVGYDAHSNKMMYSDLVDLAAKQSAELKNNHRCDIVVVIIHGGHREKEDVGLMNLPHIDVVLGGHSHESYLYSNSISSLSSQCGSSGMFLTCLSGGLTKNEVLQFRGVPERYRDLVDNDSPQCIKVEGELPLDESFHSKIQSWQKEFNDVLHVNANEVVFTGNLSHLFENSLSQKENAQLFANMLLGEYKSWSNFNLPGTWDKEEVSVYFWHLDFLEDYIVTHDSSDVIVTSSDTYSLIHTSGLKKLHSFYVTRSEVYYILQGIFVVNKMISPLISVIPGGINFDESFVFGFPLITNIRTVDGKPYDEWPAYVKVVTNSIIAPFFWKIERLTYGMVASFPKDKHGRYIGIDESLVSNSPTELELFLSHLSNLMQN